jgi:peptidoglycan hydrolase-like protein with peptidoglycan-binding domain
MKKLGIATVPAVALVIFATVPLVLPSARLATDAIAQTRDLDMDAIPGLTREGIRAVQQALQKRGFSPGPIDGVIGPLTTEAVRKFQDAYGMKTSGRVDNQTLYALGEPQLAGQSQ